MALSPVKFLVLFFLLSVVGWVLFIFAARLLAWFLSRVMGASVAFRVAGWNCLRDVVVKFKKGAVESIFVGEIKLSLRQSLVKLGAGFISRDPKLQLLICDLEVVTRSSDKNVKKKARSQKSGSRGRGKYMIVANMARFLSVSVTELAIRTPKATIETKDLRLDISKDGGSKPTLSVKLQLLPILVYMAESRLSYDQSSSFNPEGCISTDQASFTGVDRGSAPFVCEELSVSCAIDHDREAGIVISNLDVASGEVTLCLDEDLVAKKKATSVPSIKADIVEDSTLDQGAAIKPQKQSALQSLKKHTSLFPEKVSFNLPKLNVRIMHRGQGLLVENNVMGVSLRSGKSHSSEDMGESTRFDVQLDFSEIHLLREGSSSILEILKLAVVSSIYIPTQPTSPIRAEIDIKLGGTQCNIIMSRLTPWMRLLPSKKNKMVLREEKPNLDKPQSSETKVVLWTSTVSAPEMTIVLYSVTGSPLYHGCSQSSHVFANNIANTGTAVHMELGELHVHMADEYQECSKESLFGVETNSGSLIHIGKVSLDWGKKETEPLDEHGPGKCKLVLSVDVTGMGVHLNFQRVESLVSTAITFKALLKSLSPSGKGATQSKSSRSTKPSGKGTQFLKLNLERCSVSFHGDAGVEDAVVADPKRVNYGSQGGQVIIEVSADGSRREANIESTMSNGAKSLKYSVSLDIFHFSLCVNKEKQSTQIELERARSKYHEYLEEDKPHIKVTLFDMQNSKFLRRSGGLNEIAVCSLFSATDISVRWEPDVHLCFIELMLRLKSLVHNLKLEAHDLEAKDASSTARSTEPEIKNANQTDKHKKKESVFAIDVELLSISAAVGDGVEAMVRVQSIFSENAQIGVLLEGLMLSFNEARVFKSTRMQISRIPNSSLSSSSHDPKATIWDWVIQGLDVHICMPYRLQLRAIEDAVEEMMRGLKLITAAKTSSIFPKKETRQVKKSTSPKFGSLKFCIRKLTADIEEEPMQGWLDEHFHLMKNEARELAVRLNFVDILSSEDVQSSGSTEPNDSSVKKFYHNGVEIDVHDSLVVQDLREEIHKKAFQSYYRACQNLVISEGSGACKTGFQAGFKPSTARTSLLSICATELDLTLSRIDGGDTGMIEIVKKLDPVALDNSIPFSRLYGANILLKTGSLTVELRNYTFPLLSAFAGKCEGRVVLAQQATSFQPQMLSDVFVGRWRKVSMLRSVSGTTPPMKTYADLPLHFEKGEIGFGVGYEPSFTDISYAFTVALRRANLSARGVDPTLNQPPKKERSLPWWDEVRNYVHGKISLCFDATRWRILGTTDPYEKVDKLEVVSGNMDIQQSDGCVSVSAKDFKIFVSSLECLINNSSLKLPSGVSGAFLEVPSFCLEVNWDWECDSGNPLNHYLFALPVEGKPREKVFDPFRSTSLSLRWNFSLRPSLPEREKPSSSASVAEQTALDEVVYPSPYKSDPVDSPTVNVGAHDLAWLNKFWNLNYLPPQKLRSFSRWPRFGVPRIPRSGNLSLDKVMTEFMLRIDAMPTCVKHMPLDDDDPASGLTFKMARLKYEMGFGRGRQKFTFECIRDPLDLVYQGLDLHMLKVYIDKEHCKCVTAEVEKARKNAQSAAVDKTGNEKCDHKSGSTEKHRDDGFLLSSDYFTVRRQAPKADPTRLLAWQEAGKKNLEMTYVRSEFENGSDSDEHARSDQSDDDGFNVVIADNCQRIFVYGLKLMWTIENRDAVWSFVGGLSKAFAPPKPSPSRQYAQRKLKEEKENQVADGAETVQEEATQPSSSVPQDTSSPPPQDKDTSEPSSTSIPNAESSSSNALPKTENMDDSEEEGTRHFMVNVIQPQFNLHSEEANGRFLLAAASGRVLARSFHSVLHVGFDMIEKALGSANIQVPESEPEMTWKRAEFSVMLEHVQAHVAPTDVDPGAGIQWLPKILRSSPKVKRTGALLERVFMPCTMYFRYTRHKGGTSDLKVKPLKELSFNSPNITATMTSRQFQVMLDVLTNLLFARLPKPRKSSLSCYAENDEDIEEEADEVVPDGVEEVELARISLEQKERERKLLLDDIRNLSINCNNAGDLCHSPEKDGTVWMITGGRSTLVQGLKKELTNTQKSRKAASASLRVALQQAAQLRLMEKEKNKSPSCAMRISVKIDKVVWGMLVDGKSFAEAEINYMIYDFDRDYKDIGVAKFTTKSFVVRNCVPNAKSDMLLSAWNPPSEWGKNVMLRVDAKQGAPKDGNSPLELFQVVIYPLKIHLAETMYRTMWEYFFPEEEQDSQRRQEVWKVSTTAGSKRVKKGATGPEAVPSDVLSKLSASAAPLLAAVSSQPPAHGDASQLPKLPNIKTSILGGPTPELRRTSSFDRTWEENVAETVANELVLHVNSSGRSGPLSNLEQQDEYLKNKMKDSKTIKPGRPSHEEKKVGKVQDEKKPRKLREFHNIKISQVELLVTYEGSRFAVSDLRLLMDSFHRVEFIGTWRRLFSRVKKHIIWGVLKSVTGMQGKKFKDKLHGQKGPTTITGIPEGDFNLSDSEDGQEGNADHPITWLKRPSDGAGDGFVSSVRGLFNSQRRKAKAFVLRTMRGDGDNEFQGEWSDSDVEFSPFARQLTITKARRLIRRHTKKFRSKGQKGATSQQTGSNPSTPKENEQYESDYSSGSSPYEDFNE